MMASVSRKILVVDDEAAHRAMLDVVLTESGYTVHLAADGHKAVEAARESFFDLILMDIRMKGMTGLEVLQPILKIAPKVPVILMTAYASVESAVTALKAGAFDYLTKPLDIDELKILIERTLYHRDLEKENQLLKAQLKDRFDRSNIIGKSLVITHLMEVMGQVAPSEATILITGESGTGKELIASAIHLNSPRKDRPMVKVNCAALPENLLESELFGHERGAFTGAVTRRKGRFQEADGSTIFLDEMGEMSLSVQAKILRVLQEREIQPVGSADIISVDTRVIAATNKHLESEMKKGAFRKDLYFRLNVIQLNAPPLRDRREDIALLAEHFLKQYALKNRKLINGFSADTLDILTRYEWPGNVRELENVIERAVILTRQDRIGLSDLPSSMTPSDISLKGSLLESSSIRSLKEMEKEMILRTLKETGGNRTHCADILGISRRTLQLKLKAYGVN